MAEAEPVMPQDKLPALQFYPGDWHKDPGIRLLSLIERGFWFECLLLMHESERRGYLMMNGRPIPASALSSAFRIDVDLVNQILTKLTEFGVCSVDEATGCLISRRMVRDETTRRIRQKCGKLGGNPNLVNTQVNQNKNLLNQKPTPSSSSSSSSSSSISVSSSDSSKTPAAAPRTPSKKSSPAGEIREADLPESLRSPEFIAVWRDWERHRREKRSALTASTARSQLATCAKLGPVPAARMIRASIFKGWVGLFERQAETDSPTHNGYRSPNAVMATDEELERAWKNAPVEPFK